MPELPEVETISRQLDKMLRRQTILKIKVLRKKSFIGARKKVIGKQIDRVERKAKLIRIGLKPELNLVVHLKMTGQLVYDQKQGRVVGGHPTADWVGKLPSKHTRVVLELNKGKLFFNDMRVFGWIKVMTDVDWKELVKNMPPDVVDKDFTTGYLESILKDSKRPIKLILMDHKKIGGIGNIYANDGLFCAGILPDKKAFKVADDRKTINKLVRCLKRVIGMGIRYGGATSSDKSFVNSKGLGGDYQDHFLVYERKGERCRNCRKKIKKIKLGGRGTYFCPGCQQ